MSNPIQTIAISPDLRVRIFQDEDAEGPAGWDTLGQITYKRGARECLGTEAIDADRFEDIGWLIRKGELIGLPVYGYVHSGATISTTPFSCSWDSGRSGWVYCTADKAKAKAEFAGQAHWRKAALKCLQGEVETFAQFLAGEVYGYVVERTRVNADGDTLVEETLDSCWGFYGLEYAAAEGRAAATAELRLQPPDLDKSRAAGNVAH